MKVSSKIISGFLILMLLAISVVAYELSVIYLMQGVNRELAEIDVKSAETALDMEKLTGLLDEHSKKYLGRGTPRVNARRRNKLARPWKASGAPTTN